MEDHVIDLVVPVDKRASILWLCLWISEKLYHVVKVWDLSNWFACLFGYGLCLGGLYGIERPQLAIVEARGLSELVHVHTGRYNAVEFGQGLNSIFPPDVCQLSDHSEGYEEPTWRLDVRGKHQG